MYLGSKVLNAIWNAADDGALSISTFIECAIMDLGLGSWCLSCGHKTNNSK